MAPSRAAITFDRGTLRVSLGAGAGLPHALWDERTSCYRAPAFRYGEIRARLGTIEDHVRPGLAGDRRAWQAPTLRPYQADAVSSWVLAGERGILVMPTGAGKTRTAIAAMARAAVPTLVLVPTRALLPQWSRELQTFHRGPIGRVGDGEHDVRPVTVMTFESAYRHLDRLGDQFGMIVVDEAHHFGGGVRAEALEMAVAPRRLGLTATAPDPDSPAADNLATLVGPVVFEIDLALLSGTHLAEFEHVLMHVELDRDERSRYERAIRPFNQRCREFLRRHPEASYRDLATALSASPQGRAALAAYHEAVAIASLPAAKLKRVDDLLDRCRGQRVLVFTGGATAAVQIARRRLAPVITAETSRTERDEILKRFREGTYRTLVSARVLNEGLDVPEASIAIIVAGTLGKREQIQRIGRVLRPRPGKRAVVYELVTIQTLDHRRSQVRRSSHAPA